MLLLTRTGSKHGGESQGTLDGQLNSCAHAEAGERAEITYQKSRM